MISLTSENSHITGGLAEDQETMEQAGETIHV